MLKDGYEASFLALDADPLADFANVRRVALRFKQGHFIEPAARPAAAPEGEGKPANHP